MHECGEISNQGRAIHEQFEWHSWVLAIVLFNKVPYHKAHAANDERCEDVGGVPGKLLATPDEAHNKDPAGTSA